MSKSLGNTIGLLEAPESIWEKLRPAVTDPARVKRTDPGTPEVCNIYALHQAFSAPTTVDVVAQNCRTAGWGCIDCKRTLFESINAELTPIRRRAEEIRLAPERVSDAVVDGARRARGVAEQTIGAVKERMGLE